jgi:large subunit ribosomal protein L24
MANKIRKGDEVIVTTGKDKGRRGTVLQVLEDERVLVEGVNLAKKHIKPNPNVGEMGGIKDKAMPLDVSNVMVFNPKTKKGERVGFSVEEDGGKVRVFKSGDKVDI